VSHFQLTSAAQLPGLMREQVAWVLERLAEDDQNGGGGAGERARQGVWFRRSMHEGFAPTDCALMTTPPPNASASRHFIIRTASLPGAHKAAEAAAAKAAAAAASEAEEATLE
jgi:hypothetical protein